MPVTLSATTRKHTNYNTTRNSQTLKAACYDADLRKNCNNIATRTHARTYDYDTAEKKYISKNKIKITLKDVFFLVSVNLNYHETLVISHRHERERYEDRKIY
jgi:hypothetical protein